MCEVSGGYGKMMRIFENFEAFDVIDCYFGVIIHKNVFEHNEK
jgi:hypothetical protein